MEKELFELIDEKGEGNPPACHIIDATDFYKPDEKGYRVYHADGYCFDITRIESDLDENERMVYEYRFYSDWDGFKAIDSAKAFDLIKKTRE